MKGITILIIFAPVFTLGVTQRRSADGDTVTLASRNGTVALTATINSGAVTSGAKNGSSMRQDSSQLSSAATKTNGPMKDVNVQTGTADRNGNGTDIAPPYPQPKSAITKPSSKAVLPMPYNYEYTVKDAASGLDFGEKKNSDGKIVTGSYYVLLPDGRIETVTYQADENGYVAKVSYKETKGSAKMGEVSDSKTKEISSLNISLSASSDALQSDSSNSASIRNASLYASSVLLANSTTGPQLSSPSLYNSTRPFQPGVADGSYSPLGNNPIPPVGTANLSTSSSPSSSLGPVSPPDRTMLTNSSYPAQSNNSVAPVVIQSSSSSTASVNPPNPSKSASLTLSVSPPMNSSSPPLLVNSSTAPNLSTDSNIPIQPPSVSLASSTLSANSTRAPIRPTNATTPSASSMSSVYENSSISSPSPTGSTTSPQSGASIASATSTMANSTGSPTTPSLKAVALPNPTINSSITLPGAGQPSVTSAVGGGSMLASIAANYSSLSNVSVQPQPQPGVNSSTLLVTNSSTAPPLSVGSSIQSAPDSKNYTIALSSSGATGLNLSLVLPGVSSGKSISGTSPNSSALLATSPTGSPVLANGSIPREAIGNLTLSSPPIDSTASPPVGSTSRISPPIVTNSSLSSSANLTTSSETGLALNGSFVPKNSSSSPQYASNLKLPDTPTGSWSASTAQNKTTQSSISNSTALVLDGAQRGQSSPSTAPLLSDVDLSKQNATKQQNASSELMCSPPVSAGASAPATAANSTNRTLVAPSPTMAQFPITVNLGQSPGQSISIYYQPLPMSSQSSSTATSPPSPSALAEAT